MALSSLLLTRDRSVQLSGTRIERGAFQVMREADGLLREARQHAALAMATAERDADRLRQAAHREGLATGQREGLAALLGTLEVEQRLRQLLADRLSSLVEQVVRNLLGELPPGDLFRRRVQHLLRAGVPGASSAGVRLHVSPLQAPEAQAVIAELAGGAPGWIEVISDDQCAPDALVMETPTGFVDAGIELTLDAVRQIVRRAIEQADEQAPRAAGHPLTLLLRTAPMDDATARQPAPSLALGRLPLRLDQALDTALAEAAGRVALASHQRGKLQQAIGTLIRASGLRADVGELCRLVDPRTGFEMKAEVIGFEREVVVMSPMGPIDGLGVSTHVIATGERHRVPVGGFLLGRVVDGMGERFIDDGPPMPRTAERRDVAASAPGAFQRRPIAQVLPMGVNAIDALLTCGVGQRVGIFAPAGCGKSTLLSMMCRHAQVDVVVVALVGERGREVADFIHEAIGPEAMHRAVLVVATSDRPATERLKAAQVATTYAEHFAAQGRRVLLMVDSVTRFARALREIGLAAGEPPARRGFPPSVFSALPLLFERAGNFNTGSITAFYTVLEETDDGADPVSEEVRSLLDGHIVLSRKLAGAGHYPAIDVLGSTSRLFNRLAGPAHAHDARRLRELLTKFGEVEVLLRIGEFHRGADPLADEAVDRRPLIDTFLRQGSDGALGFHGALDGLHGSVS